MAGIMFLLPLLVCSVAYVSDGDTFRCRDGTRIRLAGIDAPELHGCPPRRRCAPGNGSAARRHLVSLIAGRQAACRVTGQSYDRLAAWCSVGGLELSCQMVRDGHAVRLDRYWRGHRC